MNRIPTKELLALMNHSQAYHWVDILTGNEHWINLSALAADVIDLKEVLNEYDHKFGAMKESYFSENLKLQVENQILQEKIIELKLILLGKLDTSRKVETNVRVEINGGREYLKEFFTQLLKEN